ncbi:MAG: CPBP family intramembrane glutamic endopeptidase [Candidatus Acidiferrales bacterium]|jgi:membrane protease YdiL (CAAX protease family)
MPWDFAVILVFLAAVVPFVGRRRMQRLLATEQTSKRDRLRLYASTVLSQWVAAAIILWRAHVHGIRGAQLGLAVPHIWLVIVVTVVFAGLILTNQLLTLGQLASPPHAIHGTMAQLATRIFPQDAAERVAFSVVVATVAVCEELIYRGFVQTVFKQWGHFAVLAIAAPSALFAVAHLYQGWRGILSTFVVGLCFSTIRWWTGSLLPPMISHFAADMAAGILAPRRFQTEMQKSFIQTT